MKTLILLLCTALVMGGTLGPHLYYDKYGDVDVQRYAPRQNISIYADTARYCLNCECDGESIVYDIDNYGSSSFNERRLAWWLTGDKWFFDSFPSYQAYIDARFEELNLRIDAIEATQLGVQRGMVTARRLGHNIQDGDYTCSTFGCFKMR